MHEDFELDIATGKYRNTKTWRNKKHLWSDIVLKLTETHRTSETFKSYQAADKTRRDEIKDVGGFVGAYLVNGRRKPDTVLHRTLITLDADFAPADFWDKFQEKYRCEAVAYTTHSHSPEAPRFRLVIPLSREITRDEYEPIARRIAGDLNIEWFDHTTFQAERLMYWPSTSKDGEFFSGHQEGELLIPDSILDSYLDWRDTSEWPITEKFDNIIKRLLQKQGDPLTKPGLVGAMCRAYTIQEAIEEHLSDEYEPTDVEGRYTYMQGSTAAGAIVYEDKFLYSHHSTDPSGGHLCNVFDLIRLHKFGLMDEKVHTGTHVTQYPSYKAMEDFISKDPKTRAQLNEERIEGAKSMFDDIETWADDNKDWMEGLKSDKKCNLLSTVENFVLVLTSDTNLKNKIAFNEFTNRISVRSRLPWDKLDRFSYPRDWQDSDLSQLKVYLSCKPYAFQSLTKIEDVLSKVIEDNSFHPVVAYLDELQWDREPRIATLLQDYLGAADTPLNHAFIRKALVACVTRIYNPGTKVDTMVTLIGKEGMGKSTILKKIGGEWFSDSFNFSMLNQGARAVEQIQGKWIIEAPEMAGLKKADAESGKAFLSGYEDYYRGAYMRNPVLRPRQCVFWGTTNNKDFLHNEPGNRRHWPIEIGMLPVTKSVFTDLTPEVVGQIWAEAVELYRAGESLQLTPAMEREADKLRNDHTELDPRTPMVREYLNKQIPDDWYYKDIRDRRAALDGMSEITQPKNYRQVVSSNEIWYECFGDALTRLSKYEAKAIAQIMRMLPDWEATGKQLFIPGYGTVRYYARKNDLQPVIKPPTYKEWWRNRNNDEEEDDDL